MTDAPSLPPHHERRQILATRPNPRRPIDYLVELQTTLPKPLAGRPASLVLSYVPDRLILDLDSLVEYLEALADEP
jgi:NADPH-dependent 7-cyano-7-deazaguanine reductase QueF